MKVKILNEEPESNLIVICYNSDINQSSAWDHLIAPSGSLECHINEKQYLVVFKEEPLNE